MRTFFADYGTMIATITAIINGFIAVVVAQFFKDRTVAKVLLVIAAGLLGALAIGATVLSQSQVLAAKTAERDRHQKIRDQIGKFIGEGSRLIANCGDNSKPPDDKALDAWAVRVVDYVKDSLGQSYVDRLISPAGVPVVGCAGADDVHNKNFRIVYALGFHLEQFSAESNSWP